MGFGRNVVRQTLLALLAFFLLTFALFLFWRSFSDAALINPFINPHSPIPYKVQADNIQNYLHLNLPVYLQYFGFLSGIFTGKWAYFTDSIESVLPNTLAMIALSILFAYIFWAVIRRFSRAEKISSRGQRGGAAILYPILAIVVPVVVYYVLTGMGLLLSHNSSALFGTGANLKGIVDYTVSPPVVTVSVPAWLSPFSFLFTNGQGIRTSTPTHLFLIDPLLHGNLYLFAVFLVHMLPTVISVALVLTLFLLFINSRTGNGEATHREHKSAGAEQKEGGQNRLNRTQSRHAILRKTPYLALAIIASEIYAEVIFGYNAGLGYYFPVFFSSYPPLQLRLLNVWGAVYIIFTFGLIWIFISFAGSIMRTFYSSRLETEVGKDGHNPSKKVSQSR